MQIRLKSITNDCPTDWNSRESVTGAKLPAEAKQCVAHASYLAVLRHLNFPPKRRPSESALYPKSYEIRKKLPNYLDQRCTHLTVVSDVMVQLEEHIEISGGNFYQSDYLRSSPDSSDLSNLVVPPNAGKKDRKEHDSYIPNKRVREREYVRAREHNCLKLVIALYGSFQVVIIIIDSMTSVFNTDVPLLYNHDLFESLIVKKRIKKCSSLIGHRIRRKHTQLEIKLPPPIDWRHVSFRRKTLLRMLLNMLRQPNDRFPLPQSWSLSELATPSMPPMWYYPLPVQYELVPVYDTQDHHDVNIHGPGGLRINSNDVHVNFNWKKSSFDGLPTYEFSDDHGPVLLVVQPPSTGAKRRTAQATVRPTTIASRSGAKPAAKVAIPPQTIGRAATPRPLPTQPHRAPTSLATTLNTSISKSQPQVTTIPSVIVPQRFASLSNASSEGFYKVINVTRISCTEEGSSKDCVQLILTSLDKDGPSSEQPSVLYNCTCFGGRGMIIPKNITTTLIEPLGTTSEYFKPLSTEVSGTTMVTSQTELVRSTSALRLPESSTTASSSTTAMGLRLTGTPTVNPRAEGTTNELPTESISLTSRKTGTEHITATETTQPHKEIVTTKVTTSEPISSTKASTKSFTTPVLTGGAESSIGFSTENATKSETTVHFTTGILSTDVHSSVSSDQGGSGRRGGSGAGLSSESTPESTERTQTASGKTPHWTTESVTTDRGPVGGSTPGSLSTASKTVHTIISTPAVISSASTVSETSRVTDVYPVEKRTERAPFVSESLPSLSPVTETAPIKTIPTESGRIVGFPSENTTMTRPKSTEYTHAFGSTEANTTQSLLITSFTGGSTSLSTKMTESTPVVSTKAGILVTKTSENGSTTSPPTERTSFGTFTQAVTLSSESGVPVTTTSKVESSFSSKTTTITTEPSEITSIRLTPAAILTTGAAEAKQTEFEVTTNFSSKSTLFANETTKFTPSMFVGGIRTESTNISSTEKVNGTASFSTQLTETPSATLTSAAPIATMFGRTEPETTEFRSATNLFTGTSAFVTNTMETTRNKSTAAAVITTEVPPTLSVFNRTDAFAAVTTESQLPTDSEGTSKLRPVMTDSVITQKGSLGTTTEVVVSDSQYTRAPSTTSSKVFSSVPELITPTTTLQSEPKTTHREPTEIADGTPSVATVTTGTHKPTVLVSTTLGAQSQSTERITPARSTVGLVEISTWPTDKITTNTSHTSEAATFMTEQTRTMEPSPTMQSTGTGNLTSAFTASSLSTRVSTESSATVFPIGITSKIPSVSVSTDESKSSSESFVRIPEVKISVTTPTTTLLRSTLPAVGTQSEAESRTTAAPSVLSTVTQVSNSTTVTKPSSIASHPPSTTSPVPPQPTILIPSGNSSSVPPVTPCPEPGTKSCTETVTAIPVLGFFGPYTWVAILIIVILLLIILLLIVNWIACACCKKRRRQRGFDPARMPNPAAGHPLHAVCPIMPAEYHTTHASGSYAFPPVYPASHSQSYPNLVRTGHVSGTPEPIMHQMNNNNNNNSDYRFFARHPRGSGIDGNTSTFGYQPSAMGYPELSRDYKHERCPPTVIPLPSYDYATGRLDALNGNMTVCDEDREDQVAREKASSPSSVNSFVRQRDGIRI
ncbi:hypothetical protein CSKR_112016 [Clonorchis sinensis]|uniref:Uncharacterized protein n=1 Tax=Clonorchis sinensis TaxID=79923 RepID=A0A419PYT3_CLOSI|nr:hypothetical protein CSKR_112016 [Clonorchis sinensis]